MESRSLGEGRVSVPVVGLGTSRRLEAAAAAGREGELVAAAVAAGIRVIDTSPMYGQAERLLSRNADCVERRAQIIHSGVTCRAAWRFGAASGVGLRHGSGRVGRRADWSR